MADINEITSQVRLPRELTDLISGISRGRAASIAGSYLTGITQQAMSGATASEGQKLAAGTEAAKLGIGEQELGLKKTLGESAMKTQAGELDVKRGALGLEQKKFDWTKTPQPEMQDPSQYFKSNPMYKSILESFK